MEQLLERSFSPAMEAPMNRTSPSRIRLVEIAELLGVSKQRVHQIADEYGFPAPIAENHRGRLRDRREVAAWAKEW
jgi:predicted DNA-binding transcriptional regulator AlpA